MIRSMPRRGHGEGTVRGSVPEHGAAGEGPDGPAPVDGLLQHLRVGPPRRRLPVTTRDALRARILCSRTASREDMWASSTAKWQ